MIPALAAVMGAGVMLSVIVVFDLPWRIVSHLRRCLLPPVDDHLEHLARVITMPVRRRS